MSSILVKNKIACFLDLNCNPITAKRVAMYVFKETGIRLPIHLVQNYLKEDIKLSYKIRKSRLALYDFDKNMILKSYFAIIIIKTSSINWCYSEHRRSMIFESNSSKNIVAEKRNGWNYNKYKALRFAFPNLSNHKFRMVIQCNRDRIDKQQNIYHLSKADFELFDRATWSQEWENSYCNG